jgi:serine protease Do
MRRVVSAIGFALALSCLSVWFGSPTVGAQVDPTVRDRVAAAAVQIAVSAEVTFNGETKSQFFPLGSGTVVSADGLILTNEHVVDPATSREGFQNWERQAAAAGDRLSFDVDERGFLILTSNGNGRPEPTYLAEVVAQDAGLDLAVLHVVEEVDDSAVSKAVPALTFVPLGDSDRLSLADPIDIYSYPAAGGGSLTYTTGVVSGFNFAEDSDRRDWITTDATLSGGSSGGTAVNRRGQLVGVPTQGSALDCRPFDTNNDGVLDENDGSCIPVGGSIGQLRPINLALPLLEKAGLSYAATQPASGLSKSNYPSNSAP